MKPSLTQFFNIYNAYHYLGIKAVPVVATTSLIDGALAKYMGTTRNYLGLGTFWGTAAYNMISNSEKLHTPFNLFIVLVSLGLAYKGHDFLESTRQGIDKTKDAIILSAKIFESEDKEITTIERAFKIDSTYGVFEMIINSRSLLSNKFLLNLFMKQSVEVAQCIALEAFLSKTMFISKKFIHSNLATNSKLITTQILFNIAKPVINKMPELLIYKFLNMNNEVSLSALNIILNGVTAKYLVQSPERINSFPNDIMENVDKANLGVKQLAQALLLPLFSNNISSVLEDSPGLIILGGCLYSFFSMKNIQFAQEFITNKVFKTVDKEISSGAMVQIISPESYIYLNIKAIKKYRAEEFVYNYASDYIAYRKELSIPFIISNQAQEGIIYKKRDIMSNIPFFKTIIGAVDLGCFYILLPYLGLKSPKDTDNIVNIFSKSEYVLAPPFEFTNSIDMFLQSYGFNEEKRVKYVNKLAELGINSPKALGKMKLSEFQAIIPKEIMRTEDAKGLLKFSMGGIQRATLTYKELWEYSNDLVAEKNFNTGLALTFQDYRMKKVSVPKEMLFIKELTFKPGVTYAISGKIGLGKSAFFSDILSCLDTNIVQSSGHIYYPIINDYFVPIIYSDTIPLSPPNTSLFQRITYKLPLNYIEINQDKLIARILEIFKDFGQDVFIKETLLDKSFNVSSVYNQLATLVGAILYKDYTNSPALLLIDETLSTLDAETLVKVCKSIKDKFNDSIVISIDNNCRNNLEFYDEEIDFANYCPIIGETSE